MYDILEQVRAWQDGGRPVTLARVIEIRGISSRERRHVAALTPGEAVAGSLLSGAADEQLAALAVDGAPARGRLVEVRVDDAAAASAGLSCGGAARLILQPATDVPAEAWQRLAEREPVCLVTSLDGDTVGATEVFTTGTVAAAGADVVRLFARGTSEATVLGGVAVTTLWPVPTLVVVGGGLIADALVANGALLGWSVQVTDGAAAASAAIAGRSSADGVVVLSHDAEVYGPALLAALAGRAGYIGGLGSRRTQAARAQWLAGHGVTDLHRLHGPAGLDIGAATPAEIAVSIIAEVLAVRSGRSGGSYSA